jgi:uncharacterized protein (DUF1800 family)
VVHLHRRASFAASWNELQRDLADGPDASIARLLNGQARGPREGSPESFQATAALLGDAAVASDDPARLKAWWVYRILFTPDPLGEKLALLWHNHFATSNVKVNDLAAMRAQNEIFRRLARAPFGELLNEAVRDPAMLTWLDAHVNRKGHPNENLARELMELFTLGTGDFTEHDVQDAARALTGWTLNAGQFRDIPARHDDGEKIILERTGRWSGSDLIRILLDHPATATRLARKICGLLMGEGSVGEPEIRALADELRANGLDLGRSVATVLRSRAFFSERNMRSRVLDPIAFVTGAVRALSLWEPPPSTLILAEWAAKLGQDLFYPPNVGGWPGGREWLSSRSIVGRVNYANTLVGGLGIDLREPIDALGLATRNGHGDCRENVLTFYGLLLTGAAPDARTIDAWSTALGSKTSWGPHQARQAVALILSSPEGQVA